jgi:hypothetical protein
VFNKNDPDLRCGVGLHFGDTLQGAIKLDTNYVLLRIQCRQWEGFGPMTPHKGKPVPAGCGSNGESRTLINITSSTWDQGLSFASPQLVFKLQVSTPNLSKRNAYPLSE